MRLVPLIILITNILPMILAGSAVGQITNSVSTSEPQNIQLFENTIRILTYNVRNCVGMDRITDYDRVAAIISDIHPNVVALQELDSVTARSKGVNVLKVLAEKCGMNFTYGASIPYSGGKYGIGILSTEKPVSTSFISLPGSEEKRGLLMAEFKNYILFCTHFSLTEADRVASVKLINQKVNEPHKRIFLAGDLNAAPASEAIISLTDHWINLSGIQPTFPSSDPKQCIDYIWGLNCCNFRYNIIKQEVVSEKTASDHRPVFVDVSFE